MNKKLLKESKIISEINRLQELMGVKRNVLNEDTVRIPLLSRLVRLIVDEFPTAKLEEILGGNTTHMMYRLRTNGIKTIEELIEHLNVKMSGVGEALGEEFEESILKSINAKIYTDVKFYNIASEMLPEIFSVYKTGIKLSTGAEMSLQDAVSSIMKADLAKHPELSQSVENLYKKIQKTTGLPDYDETMKFLRKEIDDSKSGTSKSKIKTGPDLDNNEPKIKPDEDPNNPKTDDGSEIETNNDYLDDDSVIEQIFNDAGEIIGNWFEKLKGKWKTLFSKTPGNGGTSIIKKVGNKIYRKVRGTSLLDGLRGAISKEKSVDFIAKGQDILKRFDEQLTLQNVNTNELEAELFELLDELQTYSKTSVKKVFKEIFDNPNAPIPPKIKDFFSESDPFFYKKLGDVLKEIDPIGYANITGAYDWTSYIVSLIKLVRIWDGFFLSGKGRGIEYWKRVMNLCVFDDPRLRTEVLRNFDYYAQNAKNNVGIKNTIRLKSLAVARELLTRYVVSFWALPYVLAKIEVAEEVYANTHNGPPSIDLNPLRTGDTKFFIADSNFLPKTYEDIKATKDVKAVEDKITKIMFAKYQNKAYDNPLRSMFNSPFGNVVFTAYDNLYSHKENVVNTGSTVVSGEELIKQNLRNDAYKHLTDSLKAQKLNLEDPDVIYTINVYMKTWEDIYNGKVTEVNKIPKMKD